MLQKYLEDVEYCHIFAVVFRNRISINFKYN